MLTGPPSRDFNITTSLSSADAFYNATATCSWVAVHVLDTSSAGVSLTPADVVVSADPASGQTLATYTLQLLSMPLFDVSIVIVDESTPASVLTSVSSVIVTAGNWNRSVTVSVTPATATTVQQQTTLAHVLTSSDPQYSVGSVSSLSTIPSSNVVRVTVLPKPVASAAVVVVDTTPAPLLVSAAVSDSSNTIVLVFDRAAQIAGADIGVGAAATVVTCKSLNVFSGVTMSQLDGATGSSVQARDRQHAETLASVCMRSVYVCVRGCASERVRWVGGLSNVTCMALMTTTGQVNFVRLCWCVWMRVQPSTCMWSTNSTLVIMVDAVSPAIVNWGSAGGVVSLRGGNIRATNSSILYSSGSVPVSPRTPAPVLLSAVLSDTGSSIVVAFDRGCSSVLGTTAGPCTALLANANLGAGATCVWLSSALLQISFGFAASGSPTLLSPMSPFVSTATCQATSAVWLLPGAISAVPNGLLTAWGCVNVAPAIHPPSPQVRILGATSLGLCASLVLDGSSSSGSGGRPMSFSWSLTGLNVYGNESVALIQEYADGFPFLTCTYSVFSLDAISEA